MSNEVGCGYDGQCPMMKRDNVNVVSNDTKRNIEHVDNVKFCDYCDTCKDQIDVSEALDNARREKHQPFIFR